MGRLMSRLLSPEFSPRRHGDTESRRRERERAEAGSEVHGFGPGRVVCEKEQDIEIAENPRPSKAWTGHPPE